MSVKVIGCFLAILGIGCWIAFLALCGQFGWTNMHMNQFIGFSLFTVSGSILLTGAGLVLGRGN